METIGEEVAEKAVTLVHDDGDLARVEVCGYGGGCSYSDTVRASRAAEKGRDRLRKMLAELIDERLVGRVIPEDARKPLATFLRWAAFDDDELQRNNASINEAYDWLKHNDVKLADQIDPPEEMVTIKIMKSTARSIGRQRGSDYRPNQIEVEQACREAVK